MIEDHDLPFEPRIISHDEAETFPQHGEPVPPDVDLEEDLRRKKDKEKVHGHPAYQMREAYREQGQKVD